MQNGGPVRQYQRPVWHNNPGRSTVVNNYPFRSAQPFYRGGRGRFNPTTSGRPGPRSPTAGRAPQQWQRPPTQPGRWQSQRPYQPEAHYSEEQTQEENKDQTKQEEENFQFDDGEATTEEELISQWNEAFFDQEAEDTFLDETVEEAQHGWQDYYPNTFDSDDYDY